MIFHPTFPLNQCISHYMVTNLEKGQKTYLPATYTPSLIVIRRGHVKFQRANTKSEMLPSAYIEGPVLNHRFSYANENSEIISVHFKPGMLEKFVFVPTSEFSNQHIPLGDLATPHLALLKEEIVNSSCINEAVKLVERKLEYLLLLDKNNLSKKTQPLLFKKRMIYKPTKELASASGISVRQLERRFMANYGVTVRDWRRLNRAAKAIISLVARPGTNHGIASIAHNAQYFDHAHMCRDFKVFCGFSPQDFSHRIDNSPSFWPLRELRDLLP